MNKATSRPRGFTLIELAVSLVVLALVIGSLLVPLSNQVEQRKVAEAQKTLDQISEALVGFALSQSPPRLPCPDSDNDGVENFPCATGANTANSGNLPWVTLGMPAQDPWGQAYRYHVNGQFTAAAGFTLTTQTSADASFTIGSNGDLRVCASAACATSLTNAVPAVLWSLGPNGSQAPTSADEIENTNNNRIFVSRPMSSATGTEFDDVVVYISRPVLLNRMVQAQKLP